MVGVCAIFLIGIVLTSLGGLTTQRQTIDDIVNRRFALYTTVMNLYADLLKISTRLHELNQDLQRELSSDAYEAQAQDIRATFEQNVGLIEGVLQDSPLNEEERELFERVHEHLKSYQTAALLVLRNTRSQALFSMQLKNLQIRQNAIEQGVIALRDYEDSHSQQSYHDANRHVTNTILLFGGIGGGCLIALLMIAQMILRAMVDPIKQVVHYAQRIADGDLSMEFSVNRGDEAGQLLAAMQHMIEKIQAIVSELGMLTSAAQQGQLDIRSDVSKYHGEFANIAQGINDTLDAVVLPLNVSVEYMKRIAKGDIPETITEAYQGDFEVIKQTLNALVEAMNVITHLAERMADGDLTIEVNERSTHDTLMQALNTMSTKLNNIVLNVKTTAENAAAGSQDISAIAELMSQGSAEQAAAAEEASASMEQMVANIRQNAENAKVTEKIAFASSKDARQGGEAVAKTIDAMRIIEDRISIIQDIAGQTNILSINATIEAAKAQDYGKGFAVVAAEVRTLAGRTREAAEEIEQFVKSCAAISEQAGDILQRLVPNSEKTAELVQEITAASHEQYVGTEQVNKAIQQLDHVIQQNAATAEQMASSAGELAAQAEYFQEAIAFFTVRERSPEEAPSEEQELLYAIQTIRAARDADEQKLAALIKQVMTAEQAETEILWGTQKIPESPNVTEQLATQKGVVLNIRNQETPNDDLDEEFERY